MKILFVAPEVAPFARTDGLADFAEALPKAIDKIGHDIRIFTPRYKCVNTDQDSRIKIYFFENEHFKNRSELYSLNGKDYPDNYEAFLSFCQGVLPLIEEIGWKPDIIHCNDWQTGPICLYAKSLPRTAIVYSIHNLTAQGYFPDKEIENFAQVGIENAHVINTVSETYAKEIQTKEYGCGLGAQLKSRADDVYGILNGIDIEVWNSAIDPKIARRYNQMVLSLKVENKIALQRIIGLAVDPALPVLAIDQRLKPVPEFSRLGCQTVPLYPGDSTDQAHRIFAGADMCVLAEPADPVRLICFKYGVVPIELLGGVKKALEAYKKKSDWAKLQQKVMSYNYSWHNSATKYISLYMKAFKKIGIAAL